MESLITLIQKMLIPVIFSVFTGVFFISIVRFIAVKKNIYDLPSARKVHLHPTPLLGGVAVVAAFSVGIFLAWPNLIGGYLLAKHLIGIIVGATILVGGGILDDRFNLKPIQQIFFPLLATLVIISSGIGVNYISNPLGEVIRLDQINFTLLKFHGLPYRLTLLSDVFTVLWLMGMMYTTKFLDGLDGLVSGITIIGAAIILILSLTRTVGQPETASIALLVGVSFLIFLFFNWHPAKIFLGESGALFSGYILGVLAILSGGKIATTLLVMGLPVLDVIWVILRRIFLEKRSPFLADRKHLHLRFLDIGFSHRQAVLLLWFLSALFGVSSLFFQSKQKFFVLLLLVILVIVLGIIVAGKMRKRSQILTE